MQRITEDELECRELYRLYQQLKTRSRWQGWVALGILIAYWLMGLIVDWGPLAASIAILGTLLLGGEMREGLGLAIGVTALAFWRANLYMRLTRE